MSVSISGDGSVTGIDQGLNVVGVVTATTISVGSGTSVSSPATNTLIVGTNNAERVRVNSSGFVGVNTSAPSQLLTVHTNGTSTTVGGNVATRIQSNAVGRDVTLQFSDNVSNSTTISMVTGQTAFSQNGVEAMRINASGNLGIGLTNPSSILHTYSTTDSKGIYIQNEPGGPGGNRQSIYLAGNTSFGAFIAGNYRPDGTALQNDFSGRIILQGSAASTDGMKFAIASGTAGNALSYTEYLRIQNNGDLKLSTVGTKVLNSSGSPILQQTGSILQVVTARNGDYYSTTSTSFTDITGLSLNITPTSSTSKIFLQLSLGRATTNLNNLDYICVLRILANGSDAININGNSSGSRIRGCMNVQGLAFNADHSPGGWSCSALESPGTTSTITYKAQVVCQGSSYAFIMNGTPNNSDTGATYHYRAQSSLTAWEIAG